MPEKISKSEKFGTDEFIKILFENIPIEDEKIRQQIANVIRKFIGPILRDFENSRIPRFALIGRTRCGKTSTLNALVMRKVGEVGAVYSTTAEPNWTTFEDNSGPVAEILDTRGVQEGTPPENAPAINSLESVKMAMREKTPDIFLFLNKAKEVNAAIKEDLAAVQECLKIVHNKDGFYPIIIGIPTQCDELSPVNFWETEDRSFYSAYWNAPDISHLNNPTNSYPDLEYRLEKLGNIRTAVKVWTEKIESISIVKQERNLKVIPICAYIRIRKDGSLDLDPRQQRLWNINELKTLMLEELPKEAQLQWIRKVRITTAQKKAADKIIWAFAAANTALGSIPMMGADLPILTALQILQILLIAYISGRDVTWAAAGEFLTASGINVGAAFLLREGFRQAIKFIPGWGNVVAGAIAGSGTLTIGKLAEAYFIERKEITPKSIAEAKASADEMKAKMEVPA